MWRAIELRKASAKQSDVCTFGPTDRQRGGVAFVETRSGAYFGKLGYLAGLGRSSEQIAAAMGDGIHPSYVRTILKRWGVPRDQVFCQVPITNQDRYALNYRAEQAGLSPEEWLRQVIHIAVQQRQCPWLETPRAG